MKILLIRPPIYSCSITYPSGPRFGLPISLLYLASSLEKADHTVIIYDSLIDFDIDRLCPNDNGIYHIGASWQKIAETVGKEMPQLIGITNPFSDFFAYAIKTAQCIKHEYPSIPIIAGGPHATSDPGSFLTKDSGIDYIQKAECELAFVKLVECIENKSDISTVPNLAYRNGAGIQVNPSMPFIQELDSLPLPAYHLVDMEKYFQLVDAGFPSRFSFSYRGSEREVSILTSRGCPYGCIFCGNHLHMGKKWRYNSIPYIINHMQLLIEKYKVQHFHIEDDNLGLKKERFEEFLDCIISRKWNITWDTPNGIRADRLTQTIIRKARVSGCTYMIFGIESGNQNVLQTIVNKNLNLTKVVEVASYTKKEKLDTHGFYVVGFPGETKSDIFDTFNFAKKLLWKYDIIPHLCLARPLKGTPLYDICEKSGFLTEPIVPEIGSDLRGELFPRRMIHTPQFAPAELERWVNTFNRQVVLLICFKTVLFLIFHPTVGLRLFYSLLKSGFNRRALVRLFYSGLFYKFNYLRI